MNSKTRWVRWAAAAVLTTAAMAVPATAASAATAPDPSFGCSASSDIDVAIPDNGTASSVAVISGCVFVQAPSTAVVDLHIVHPRRGDLVVDLVSPDGQAFRLRDSDPTDEGANIDETVLVSLAGDAAARAARSSVVVNGRWVLRVQDVATRATGFIDAWSLSLS